jgi:glycosyltransferase involved in cell wall biosynthesis
MIISRGETALSVAEALRYTGYPAAKFVFEAHRLCFAHAAEQISGERWREDGALTEPIRRIKEREQRAVTRADGIICLTEGVANAMREEFHPTQPILILPSGTSVSTLPVRSADRDIDVLYVGKLLARKGLEPLIAAMQYLPGRRLVIVGGGAEEREACKALSRSYDVSDRVECVGFVQPACVRDYLSRAKVGVCPLPEGVSVTSEHFTSPMKVLEMMAHGIPIVASDLPSIRAILRHNEDALLTPPNDPAAFAEAVRTLLDNPTLGERWQQQPGCESAIFP